MTLGPLENEIYAHQEILEGDTDFLGTPNILVLSVTGCARFRRDATNMGYYYGGILGWRYANNHQAASYTYENGPSTD